MMMSFRVHVFIYIEES